MLTTKQIYLLAFSVFFIALANVIGLCLSRRLHKLWQGVPMRSLENLYLRWRFRFQVCFYNFFRFAIQVLLAPKILVSLKKGYST